MRLLIITPTAFPYLTGNAITVERWRRFLVKLGIRVKVIGIQNDNSHDDFSFVYEHIRDFKPDVVHAHHAFKTGRLLVKSDRGFVSGDIPFVISCAGTDINHDIASSEKRGIILEVLKNAKGIITQSKDIAIKINDLSNDFQNRVYHVPKSLVWLGSAAFDLRAAAGCKPRDILFFLPAGIRPVKRNLECLKAFIEVNRTRPSAKIVFAGPKLDAKYVGQFLKMLERCEGFARWIPAIPPEAMRSAYSGADIILNTSSSEGFSNVLLEALTSGRPILASDIQSNRLAVIGDNSDRASGYLFDFDNKNDFVNKAVKLIDNEDLRKSFAENGLIMARKWPKPEKEAKMLFDIYKKAIA